MWWGSRLCQSAPCSVAPGLFQPSGVLSQSQLFSSYYYLPRVSGINQSFTIVLALGCWSYPEHKFSLWIFLCSHGIHKFSSGDKAINMLLSKTAQPFPDSGVVPFSQTTGWCVSIGIHPKGNFITIGLWGSNLKLDVLPSTAQSPCPVWLTAHRAQLSNTGYLWNNYVLFLNRKLVQSGTQYLHFQTIYALLFAKS